MIPTPSFSIDDRVLQLRSSRLAGGLSDDGLHTLARVMSGTTHTPGDVLIRQGEPGHRLHLITAGRVEVSFCSPGGTVTPLASLGAGDCVGEMSLLTGDPASAEVTAIEPTQTLALDRSDFAGLLLAQPQVVRELVRIISRRLGSADAAVGAAREEERQLKSFLRDEKAEHYGELVGKHASLQAVKRQLAQQALRDTPLLIHGERGVGKEAVARLIHGQSSRRDGPLLSVECGQISETPWGDKLFGARDGSSDGRISRTICYLTLAEGGTLLLGDIEALPPALQDRLARMLAPPPMGDPAGHPSVRLIATSQQSFADLCAAGVLTSALAGVIADRCLAIPPLRDRKRDIPELANHFARKFALRLGKAVPTLEDQAISRLVSHDYRIANVRELMECIERAVILADRPVIEAEQIFFRTSAPVTPRGINFLATPGSLVRRAIRILPPLFQWAVALFFLVLLYFCFFGPAPAEHNPATVLVWSVWWPALVLSFLVVGRVWCALCPMAMAGSLAQRLKSLQWRVPDWIRNHDMLLVGIGFFLIVWIEEVTAMRQSPFATGLLLLAIGGGAVLTSILFPRRTWCRHLCPLGGVAGLCSANATLELRPTFDVCAAKCKGHFCYKGDATIPGCPMFNHVMFVDSNQHCVLCMNCVQSCPEGSPQLNIRMPARELWFGAGAGLQTVALIAMLAGVIAVLTLLQKLEHAPAGWIANLVQQNWASAATALLVAGATLPLAILRAGLRLARVTADSPAASRIWRGVLAWTPLVTTAFASYELGFVWWLDGLRASLDLQIPLLGLASAVSFSVLGLVRIGLLSTGLIVSFLILWKLSRPNAEGAAQIGERIYRLSLTAAAGYWAVLALMIDLKSIIV